ncbi:hypothetical protein HRG84_23800 [Flavisolibacter sp. BT320]|nr:hypothetical protein [Flavisolibacter longurius]
MQDQSLNTGNLYEILKERFPEQNDFFKTDYKEELEELKTFGVTATSELNSLIDRHIEEVLEIDSDPLDEEHIKWYSEEYGEAYVRERVKNNYWFAYPALLRMIMELEFEEAYKTFSNKRDGV